MKTDYKPIRRSEQLALLSREHFEDILFVWKIRQGILNGVEPKRIARFVDWFWKNQLQHHFEAEELEITGILPPDHPMMVKLSEEHEAIREKIKAIGEFASYEGLERLARIVECHVRFEEGYLFHVIEEAIGTLSTFHPVTEKINEPEPEWKDKFWTSRN